MAQKIRLDKILIQLGYATDEQIMQALQRQKARGGRFGSHLLYFKFITAEQLAHALSVQSGMPAFNPDEQKIHHVAVRRIPAELAEQHMILPISFDKEKGALSIAVADPNNIKGIEATKRMFRCLELQLYIAPEAMLKELITRYYRGEGADKEFKEIIELPDLFETSSKEDPEEISGSPDATGDTGETNNVLMISRAPFLEKYLAPIFEREGLHLHVMSGQKELNSALGSTIFQHVLISKNEQSKFETWVRDGLVQAPKIDILSFDKVSSSLLQNPAPYGEIVQCLHRTLRVTAELRCSFSPYTPPYDLICDDVKNLAECFELSRLAKDALYAAALLLVPQNKKDDADPSKCVAADIFPVEIHKTIEYARSIHFPFPIDDLLATCIGIFMERKEPTELEFTQGEILLAAQILALVWYRHTALDASRDTFEEYAKTVKNGLRKLAGKMAPSEVVEAYIHLLEQNEDKLWEQSYYQIFIVGEVNSVVDLFATRLKHMGYHPVRIYDLEEAHRMCKRLPPTAIFVHCESFPEEAMKCKELLKTDNNLLLYAITMDRDPHNTLDLFDAGFDDVFAPPHDFNIIAVRLRKSFQNRTRIMANQTKPGGFSAGFKAFSFTDLLQALGQSQKSVLIRLSNSAGETADIYMRQGVLVHATCGSATGPEAVYRLIAWQDDGEYVVEPETDFPKTTITEPIEKILMDGCRILDESTVGSST